MSIPAEPPVRIALPGAPISTQGPLTDLGWDEASCLISEQRGAGATPQTLPLDPDAVLELVLDNGDRLLVTAEDAGRYLGGAGRDAASGEVEIRVGRALRLTGPHLPGGPSRDGLGAWLLKAVRIYEKGPAAMTALAAAGRFQDWVLEDRAGLFHMDADQWALTPTTALPASDQPTLLFIHGTASSTSGSFQELWATPYRAKIAERYGKRVYGFEHRSLTDGPVANALALARCLPNGARLHLVTHSRGGLVGELLARGNRIGQAPFTEDEIQAMLKQAARDRREGYVLIGEQLRELNRELQTRRIHVERFVRVACPARGTTLASGRLDRWASVMLTLFGRALGALPGLDPVSHGYALFKSFLLAVVKARTDAAVLPGLEAMMPDSPLIALLNAPGVRLSDSLHVLAGDYQGDGLLAWLGDCLSEAFYGGQTDLVVNTPSMTGGAERELGLFECRLQGAQVHHLSYFKRAESAEPLIQALEGNDAPFQRLAAPSQATISRAHRRAANPQAPILLLLPGIMGSHLRSKGDRIWFDPFDLIGGGMARLRIDAPSVDVDGWLESYYGALADHLARTHEVRPFAYDWRRSLIETSSAFARVLDEALSDAERRHQPVRILAHSMGGLVARLALKGSWERFRSIPGSRLLQIGTPNQGSHAMAAVLLGRDDFVQMIERWLDWRHNRKEFLDIVRHYPGVLELLPWPGRNGVHTDGTDYFAPETWLAWQAADPEQHEGDGWLPPLAESLQAALQTVQRLEAAPVDPACTCYVAGSAPTPRGVRIQDGVMQIDLTPEGDGRVLWATGIPAGVRPWYADAAHGDLPRHRDAFEAYQELLETGHTCKLPQTPPQRRTSATLGPTLRTLRSHTLYPSADEVLAAALGGGRAQRPPAPGTHKVLIEVVHGSLAGADAPVVVGAYAGDPIQGSGAFLNRLLGGILKQADDLGRYPSRLGEATVFLNPKPGAKPGGAIVVGLGPIGELLPGQLTRALTQGFKEFALVRERDLQRDTSPSQGPTEVAALMAGTGYGGVGVEIGARCLLEAVTAVNQSLARFRLRTRIDRLTLFEEAEDRAILALQTLLRLSGEPRFQDLAVVDGTLRNGDGGYRRSCVDAGGSDWHRLHITRGRDGDALRFTLVTGRARNEINEEPNQRQAVDGLIAGATGDVTDQRGLSRALFELMIPNAFKSQAAELSGLVLGVDATAAAYPWELMRDSGQPDEPPLVARVGVVRQLASTRGRGRVPTVGASRAFVVGDTQSGEAELRGAQTEARLVARLLGRDGYEVQELIKASPDQVLINLLDQPYRIVHLAGHGVVSSDTQPYTGMLLGPKTVLTSAQISKLQQVPEFVFINCCHLGNMTQDAARQPWAQLAANLATEFIEMGCKAVVAAGWAVDDQAATTFAETFYAAMLAGERFGNALLKARAETWRRHRGINTWGAYQAYGDDRYTFRDPDERQPQDKPFVHAGQLVAELELIGARIGGAAGSTDELDQYRKRLEQMEQGSLPRFADNAEVRERFGIAWAALRDFDRAIRHYRVAISQEVARVRLQTLEQLGNLEVRRGAEIIEREFDEGIKLLETGQKRLELLLDIEPTAERLSLLGSCWKRLIQVANTKAGKRRVIDTHLGHMTQAYWDAGEQALLRNGERDYYPLLNALEGAFLLKARGIDEPFDGWQPRLPHLLADAERNARRRFDEERKFFHALTPSHCRLVEALWNCLSGAGGRLTDEPVRQAVAQGYVNEVTRLGSLRELDSVTHQLKFLDQLLPTRHKAIKEALALLDLEINKRLRD